MFLNQMWKGVSKISSLSSTPLPPPPATNLVGPSLPPHYLAGPLSSVALPRQISLLRQRTLEKLLDPPWVWATGSRKMFSSQTPPSYFLLSPLWKDHKIQICQLLPLHPFVEFFWVLVGTPLASIKSVWDIVFLGSLCWANKKKCNLTIILLVIYISYRYCYVNRIETFFWLVPDEGSNSGSLRIANSIFYLLNIWVSEFLVGLWLGVLGAIILFEIIWKKLMCHCLIGECKTKFFHQVVIKFRLFITYPSKVL